MTSFFGKLGKALETAAKDTGKGVEIAGKDTAKVALPVAADIAPDVLPLGSGELVSTVLGLVNSKLEGKSMNPLEQFAFTIVLGVLQTVVKNPAHAAMLKTQLTGLADDIYTSYGMTPPTPAAQPAATAATKTS